MRVLIALLLVVAAIVGGRWLMLSDVALLGKDVCLSIASNEILGNRLYGDTCPRSSYLDTVEVGDSARVGGDTFIFRFEPAMVAAKKCSRVSVIVDRKSGEAWVVK